MQYRSTKTIDDDLSILGYGCMRFSKRGARTDRKKAEREMALALERGVNYFDTAYIYGDSEEVLGEFASKDGRRERMLVATKLPHYTCKNIADCERLLNEQLKRLRTDYIDYYLMHMLTSAESWERCVQMGVPEWLEAKKDAGVIRHTAFSYHGGRADFPRIVDAYPWDLAQIQLNYLDAGAQAGLDGLFYAAARGLAVVIMEPLRGGSLATKLPAGAQAAFEKASSAQSQDSGESSGFSPAQWALRWLFDLPEVTCVLSGMNDIVQIEENCRVASTALPNTLTAEHDATFDKAVQALRAAEKVPCTGCGYCLPCSQGIDIPTCFRCLNTLSREGWITAEVSYLQTTALKAHPDGAGLCTGCGRCTKHCPQGIDIPAMMAETSRVLEGPAYNLVKRFKGVYWKS